VIQDGEASYILKDSEQDTIFQIGSVAKSFTGFGVLMLEDMGLLSVYDSVNQHLPWFWVNYNGTPVPHEDITIYNLLHHTSGFTSDERFFERPQLTETTTEWSERFAGVELSAYPSTVNVYTNINYILLGLIIESASGQSYDEFMTSQILHPLEMCDTFIDFGRAQQTGRLIGGNRLRFMQPVSWEPPHHTATVPTGRIYSSVADMARWAGLHLGSLEVSEQFARVTQRSHELNGDSEHLFAHRRNDGFYAAGLGISFENGSISSIAHNGSNRIFC